MNPKYSEPTEGPLMSDCTIQFLITIRFLIVLHFDSLAKPNADERCPGLEDGSIRVLLNPSKIGELRIKEGICNLKVVKGQPENL